MTTLRKDRTIKGIGSEILIILVHTVVVKYVIPPISANHDKASLLCLLVYLFYFLLPNVCLTDRKLWRWLMLVMIGAEGSLLVDEDRWDLLAWMG